MYKGLIFLFFCLITGSLRAQHEDESAVVPELRDAWIQSAVQSLKSVRPGENLPELKLSRVQEIGYARIRVRVLEEGRLNIGKNEWVCFRSTSAHEHPETGDITLAMDHKGKIYINLGHVCGEICFETSEIPELSNTREFFKYFISAYDKEKWKQYKGH
jgi:hypothetical protein